MQARAAESALAKMKRELTGAQKDLDATRASLEAATFREGRLQAEVTSKANEVRSLQESVRNIQGKLRLLQEDELPKAHEELAAMKDRARTLQTSNEAAQSELSQARAEKADLLAQVEEYQAMLVQSTSELADRKAQVQAHQAAKDELLQKLASNEHALMDLKARCEDAERTAKQSERVRQSLEEKFNQEVKGLRAANAELRAQFGQFSTGKSDLTARMERLQLSLADVERRNEELQERVLSKETALSQLRREHEVLLIDQGSMEAELRERIEMIKRLEGDLAKARLEARSGSNQGSAELLQSKIDSLSSMNGILREQLGERERHIRQMEEKLTVQEREMRQAMAEVEHQNRKLKKRETLIAQALKRLEVHTVEKTLFNSLTASFNFYEFFSFF